VTYSLGVDLGTTFVAAAIARPSGTEMLTLSGQSVVAPALVYLREDGVLVTGEAARRRAVTAPDRVGREFKRRLGDPTPIMLGGQVFGVTTLLGALLREVLDQVRDLEGGGPERVALTHPANWGGFRRGLFEEVPAAAGLLGQTITFSEPEAASAHYAVSRRLQDGQIVAVYDLGGGTFDATILRGTPDGVEILGRPEGLERLGGIDFDESILSHVNVAIGGLLNGLDMSDPATALAVARLRLDCTQAKESLSVDTETVIPVFLPGRHTEVRLTRGAFEDMIRAPVESSTEALLRTVHSANLQPTDLSAVLLVGGSSRIPLIAEIVSAELGCKTVIDAHPKYTVALGAATLGALDTAIRTQALSPMTGEPSRTTPPNTPSATPRGVTGPPRETPARSTPRSTPPPVAPPHAGPSASPTSPIWPAWNAAGAPAPVSRTPPPRLATSSANTGSAVRGWGAITAVLLLLALAGLGYALWSAGHQGSPAPPGETGTPASAAGTSPPPPVKPAPAASLATPTVAGSFPVGAAPQAGAITPDGKLAYITSTATHSITIVDLATSATVGHIPVSIGPPQYVAFTPDGRYAYVSVYDEIRASGNAVAVIDTAARTIIATVPAEKFPFALAISPDGQQVYVPNHDVNIVSVIKTSQNTVSQKISVKPNPHAVAFSVDGRRAYVANHVSNLVTVIDTHNGAILTEIPVGHSPHSIAMSPDRSAVYVVDYDGNTVTVINPITNAVTTTIPVGLEPQSVAFAPDSKHAYIVNDGNNTVSIIDTATNKVTATLTVGQDPTNVFVAPDGKHAYITNISSDNVTVLNTG
jgi:YVTN family beta-propeller protein